MDLQDCRKRVDHFCFCCARYLREKQRIRFTENLQKKYKATFNMNKILNVNENFVPKNVCITCSLKISAGRSKKNNIKTPARWNKPKNTHEDCYICHHNLSRSDKARATRKRTKKNKNPFEYQDGLNVILPVYYQKDESRLADPQTNNKDAEMDTNNKMESSDEE